MYPTGALFAEKEIVGEIKEKTRRVRNRKSDREIQRKKTMSLQRGLKYAHGMRAICTRNNEETILGTELRHGAL